MLPLCNKLETYHPTGSDIDQSKHGHDGPIHISDGGYRGESENQFMETVKGMGYNSITDLQDLEANGAFSVSYLIPPRYSSNIVRNGIDMFRQTESVKMLRIDISTHFSKMANILTCMFSPNQKSFVYFLTNHPLRKQLVSNTKRTKNINPLSHSRSLFIRQSKLGSWLLSQQEH